MESPFEKQTKLTAYSPPRAPAPGAAPKPQDQDEDTVMVSTSEIQSWLSNIEQCLNEVCFIAADGKLNKEQQLRIHNLCRKVAHGSSQMAVQNQSLKSRAINAHTSLQELIDRQDLPKRIYDLQQAIEKSTSILT